MATEYSRSVLKIAVAQICQNLGWNSTQVTPLELLTDVMERYILELGNIAHRYSEQFGRTEVNLDDVGLAFQQMGVRLDELTEYISHVEPVPFVKEIVAFPAPKKSNLQFPNPRSREILQHREEHIPEYLPHMFPGGKDDVDEPLSSEVVGLAPEFASPMDVSPAAAESRSTTTSAEGPPNKRPRISSASLPPEADPSQYEMMSVSMSQEGELTPKRQGKLPDNRTPPAGFKQALFRDPQPSPKEQLKDKVKEKYSESEKEKSDIDVVYDSDNKSNNHSSISEKKKKSLSKDSIKSKKFKLKPKLSKNDGKKSVSGSKVGESSSKDGKKSLNDKKKKKKVISIDKLGNVYGADGKPIKINKNKNLKKDGKTEKENKDTIKQSLPLPPEKALTDELLLSLPNPDDESSNSRGDSPERLVIASESDMKEKQKSARLATVDDCIDEVIRQSVVEVESKEIKSSPEHKETLTGDSEKPKSHDLADMDDTINSVIRQTSEDNDTSSVEIKLEPDSEPQSSSATPKSPNVEDDKLKKKRKLKNGKSKDKGVREKLKKKLISKSQKPEIKKPVIPKLPDKYLTDAMKVFAFSDSPERPEPEIKQEPVDSIVSEPPAPPSPSPPPIPTPALPIEVKTESLPDSPKPKGELREDASVPTSKDSTEQASASIKTETDGEKKPKDKEKHKSKEHKKDKKDKRDKDKKKKKKKDKDREKDREKDKERGGDKDEKKEKKKDKSKYDKEKKPKEIKDEPPSTPTFPRLKLNIKLGGTPISSTSVLNSPSASALETSIASPKLEPGTPSRPSIGSPSRPEIPKLQVSFLLP
ncbi:hypothetical protein SNE40_015283 [Patella caerulea]|uniref:Bromodomain associated domain-containing protein n=1 Tax=Patella caerulea TaxID=87958 RepID=A0AAN8PRU6_PATCE